MKTQDAMTTPESEYQTEANGHQNIDREGGVQGGYEGEEQTDGPYADYAVNQGNNFYSNYTDHSNHNQSEYSQLNQDQFASNPESQGANSQFLATNASENLQSFSAYDAQAGGMDNSNLQSGANPTNHDWNDVQNIGAQAPQLFNVSQFQQPAYPGQTMEGSYTGFHTGATDVNGKMKL